MCRMPVAKDKKEAQKLQPSISFLVVSGRAPKNQANNYREFPVAHQWKHQLKKAQMKPRQCNVPKNPWPRAKHLQPSISLLVASGTPTVCRKRGIHAAKRPQLSGERDRW